MRPLTWRRLAWGIAAAIAITALIAGESIFYDRFRPPPVEARLPQKPEAPPDLAKFRDDFTAGLDALRRRDGDEAARRLGSFEFRGRDVEEYRLYYLAAAHELRKDAVRQRNALAALSRRDTGCVCSDAAAMKLASLYANRGDWGHAATMAHQGALRSTASPFVARVEWEAVESQLYRGDVAGALDSARAVVIRAPAAPESIPALAAIRSLEGLPEGAASGSHGA
jgi:hypothetical protein